MATTKRKAVKKADEKLLVSKLDKRFMEFGNKGAVWGDTVHIYGDKGILCGTPALSTNWARIWEHPTIGCQKCLKKYHAIVCKKKPAAKKPAKKDDGKIKLDDNFIKAAHSSIYRKWNEIGYDVMQCAIENQEKVKNSECIDCCIDYIYGEGGIEEDDSMLIKAVEQHGINKITKLMQKHIQLN